MTVETLPIEKIIPYAKNPRRNERAIALVAGSIKEFGFRQPIVVDTAMVVIAGHTRLEAARQLGLAMVPVHIATEMSEAQAKAFRLADNRLAQESKWDNDLLKLEMQELEAAHYDLALTAMNWTEIDALLADTEGNLVRASQAVDSSQRRSANGQLSFVIERFQIPMTTEEHALLKSWIEKYVATSGSEANLFTALLNVNEAYA